MKLSDEAREIKPYPYLPDLDAGTVREYLDALQEKQVRGLQRGAAANLLRRLSTRRLRDWVKLNGTVAFSPFAKRQARAVLRRGPLKLNLGSGPIRIAGWVNVDILGMSPDVVWDLRRGIPFPDGSADAVFLEHVLEHFALADVLDVLDECRRVLKPGGVVRAGVPDFGRYLESYAGDGRFVEELRPGRPTRLLAVAEVALSHGHRSVWDAATLECVLREAGFDAVKARPFGDSDLDPAPDTRAREPESVYAEGRKPTSA